MPLSMLDRSAHGDATHDAASPPPPSPARPRLRRLRGVPDRLLHRIRRRKALAALTARRPPSHVLVVCTGNIFRSPFAAAVLRRDGGSRRWEIVSGGLTGPGRPSPATALAAAKSLGVDLSAHRSDLVTGPMAQWADLIVVMEEQQRREIGERFGRPPGDILLLGDLDPERAERRAIEDPFDQPLEVCRRSYERIERCVKEFVRATDPAARAKC